MAGECIRLHFKLKTHKPKHTVVKVNTNAINTVIGRWWTEQFEEDEDGAHKLVELVEEFKTGPTGKNSTYTKNMLDRRVHLNTYLHRSGVDAFHQGGHVLLPFATEQKNIKEPTEEYTPDTSRWCNYRFRLIDKVEVLNLKNPTTRTIGTPLFLEFVNGRTDGNSVLVKFGDEYGIRDLRIPPVKAVTGILLFGIDSIWTPFSPWTCQGSPLISPHIIDVNDDMLKTPAEKISYNATYIPNESGWNSYHFIISQNIKSLKLGKTTVHTVGAQLFLNFVNNRSEPVIVTFDNEYAAGKGIMLSPNEVVSGIMLFDERNRWRLYTSMELRRNTITWNRKTSNLNHDVK